MYTFDNFLINVIIKELYKILYEEKAINVFSQNTAYELNNIFLISM